jgi:hypothetical protein
LGFWSFYVFFPYGRNKVRRKNDKIKRGKGRTRFFFSSFERGKEKKEEEKRREEMKKKINLSYSDKKIDTHLITIYTYVV